MRGFTLLGLLASLVVLGQALTPTSYLSQADKTRLKSVLQASLTSSAGSAEDLSLAVSGLVLLKENVPADACKKLQDRLNGAQANLAHIFFVSTAGRAAKCSLKAPADATQAIKNILGGSDPSVQDLYYAAAAQKALGNALDSAAVLKTLQATLKKDDGVASLGLAFNLATILDGDVKNIFARIEDAVVQADEVDGKMLQFEGGLTITNQVVSGAYKLSAKVGKAPPISKMQSVKFANYFMSRKSVQTSRGAFNLLEALDILTSNKFHIPVAITLGSSSNVVSESTPKVSVRITDLLGNSLGRMAVTIDSAMRQSDGAVIMSKSKMNALEDTLYDVDMMATKPGRGFYELTVTATPNKADERLVGNTNAVLLVKALGSVIVTDAEIGIADADQGTAAKMNPVQHPNKLSKALEADHHHKVVLKFALQDKASKEKIRAHQVFVRLSNAATGSEIIFVAEPDSKSVYKFDLDVSLKSKDFGARSGKYALEVIVGDAVISNPISWLVTDINLKFAEEPVQSSGDSSEGVKPEIRHLFREPEPRPPATVSSFFTLACLAPFLVMIVLWLRLGINISSFPVNLYSLGFHLGLGAIFGLYYCFWLQLDMFTTIKYLMMVGVVTFLCGNKLLVGIAERRSKAE